MSLHRNKLRRKRDGSLPFSGSVVESNPTPTVSSLVQNTAAVADPNSTGIPLLVSDSSTPTAQSSTPTASATASSSASSGNQIPLGTVIGACIAALIALILAVLLAYYCSKRQKQSATHSKSRNAANNVSRRRSHLEPWTQMSSGADRWEGKERQMTQRPLSGPIGAMFQRTLSNTSGEKSSEAHNRESVGTMRHFAKYHPGLAAEMASQGTVKAVDGKVTKPPPVLHLVGRGSDIVPPISWDGETVGGESFMSLHSSLASSTSPALAKSTPPATASSTHRWESAEVVHVNQGVSEAREPYNPFADRAASIRSSIKSQNPFFSGRDHPVRRTLPPDTPKVPNPFADPDPPRDSEDAIQSLIAALEEPIGSNRIVSVQSSVYSRMTADDGDSTLSVTAFPYPPTRINVR